MDVTKKIIDLRKYFFTNLAAIIGYIAFYINVVLAIVFNLSADITEYCSSLFRILLFYIYILTIIEALIRKYILSKIFPNFKLNPNFGISESLAKKINIIYTVVFYLGLCISIAFFIDSILWQIG